MLWLKNNHDNCPTCRQALWKEEVYKKIQAEFPPDPDESSSDPPPQPTHRRANKVMILFFVAVMAAATATIVCRLIWQRKQQQMSPVEPVRDPPPTEPVVDRITAIQTYIQSVTLSGQDSLNFESPDTPEEKALSYIIYNSTLGARSPRQQFHLIQQYVLLIHLYQAYDFLPSGILDDFETDCTLRDINNNVFAESVIVECSHEEHFFYNYLPTTANTIVRLQLPTSLRNDIGLLPSLLSLQSLSSETDDNNDNKTPLPESVGRLTRLESFTANTIMGLLPDSIQAWTQLRELDLTNSHVTGTIPTSMSNWTNLESFVVLNNAMEGNLPSWMAEAWAPNMKTFRVDNNQFSGTLPNDLSQWSSLSFFSVADNAFSGAVPNVGSASTILLSGTQLTGNLTETLCTFVQPNTMIVADCDEVHCDCCQC